MRGVGGAPVGRDAETKGSMAHQRLLSSSGRKSSGMEITEGYHKLLLILIFEMCAVRDKVWCAVTQRQGLIN